MRIITDPKLDFSDVLIVPNYSTVSSRKDVTVTRDIQFKHTGARWGNSVPIIVANMDTVGTIEMANALDQHRVSVALHKHYSVEELVEFFGRQELDATPVFYSLGITQKDLEKHAAVEKLMLQRYGLDQTVSVLRFVCIDVANGYTEDFKNFVARFRDANMHTIIMAGNVVTPDIVHDLVLAGADIVKIGIGSGSVCTTRKVTGVGYPQLSAIIECADAAHHLDAHICSDGGVTQYGDFGKAYGAGADFVMAGGMFAGHYECEGQIVTSYGLEMSRDEINDEEMAIDELSMVYYGMSSTTAQEKHNGGVAGYRASEGKTVTVPYRGHVANTMQQILGGIRSTCTYVGAREVEELRRRVRFIRVNRTHNTVFGDEK